MNTYIIIRLQIPAIASIHCLILPTWSVHLIKTTFKQHRLMTTRSRRGPRIDYNALDQSGRIVELQSDYQLQAEYQSIMEDSNDSNHAATVIITDVLAGIEELKDMMDEHQIYGSSDEDNTDVVQKLMNLRSSLRKQMLQLKAIDPNLHSVHENSFAEAISQVKDFIKTSKDYKSKQLLRTVQAEEEKSNLEIKSQMFAADDMNINLARLESIFTSDLSNYDDQHLLLLKNELPEYDKTFRSIAEKYEQLMKSKSNDEKLLSMISDIGQRYMKLSKMKGDLIYLISLFL